MQAPQAPQAPLEESTKVDPTTIMLRGLRKQCARCGQGDLFHHWTEMVESCPRCGLVYEQEEGYWVGALTYNTMVTLTLFSILIGVGVSLTWPDTPVFRLVGIGTVAGILFPIFFYPYSKTIWVATDLIFFHPQNMKPGSALRKSR